MTVVKEGGEILDVMTSAMLVLDALENATVQEAFPVEAMFTLKGEPGPSNRDNVGECWRVTTDPPVLR